MADRDSKGQFVEGHKGFKRKGDIRLISRRSEYYAHKLFDSLKIDNRLEDITGKMDIKDLISLIKIFTPKDLNVKHSGELDIKHAQIIIDGKPDSTD